MNTLELKSRGVLTANRIPKDYFVAKGKGQSDITVHAGSFHLALKDAGIEAYNIMTYSSILPGIAQEIAKPETLPHGCVMAGVRIQRRFDCEGSRGPAEAEP